MSLHAYQFCALQTFCIPRANIKQSNCVSLLCSSATGGGPSPLSVVAAAALEGEAAAAAVPDGRLTAALRKSSWWRRRPPLPPHRPQGRRNLRRWRPIHLGSFALGSFALVERADGPTPVALVHLNETHLLCLMYAQCLQKVCKAQNWYA